MSAQPHSIHVSRLHPNQPSSEMDNFIWPIIKKAFIKESVNFLLVCIQAMDKEACNKSGSQKKKRKEKEKRVTIRRIQGRKKSFAQI